MSEEALRIVKERKEVKSNGEKERYIQLNPDFQRTARRDKKAFFNDQCIKPEENNRRGKTGDLFGKTRYQGKILPKDRHNKVCKW